MLSIRDAVLTDLNALLSLEKDCFEGDRINRRQFRYLLIRNSARTLVAEDESGLLGYVLLLFSRATSVARLYSIAVAQRARGQGIGRALVAAAENAAWQRKRAYLRLEIRRDNLASQHLFEHADYRQFGILSDYYADHMAAFRYEKTLSPDFKPELKRVPFYQQTLDFTCGSSSLMMAMQALRPNLELNRTLELRIWRESTTIFMTSGHGGCGPLGLALAAHHRDFGVAVFVNDPGVPLIDSVRSLEKKEVMRLVHEEMLTEVERLGIPMTYGTLSLDKLQQRWDNGAVPLVLISSYRIYQEKFPHWVVITGFDEYFVYVHDPYVDIANGETPLDSIDMPIQRDEFARMVRYGKVGLQAVVLVWATPQMVEHG
ncbi:GNAT family N-acetyltransferase/peptidase C39 family protein [Chromatium okenii]|uniref:GNAT family N-acetyltransferase/peptidase C39 family protein n=1 Tax=Chromatium okenii TaxID=61644 RepID=UPI0026EE916A|nr:GNAT family N-acetyltransferase/peptidase C39 family protein [Chromatium okenii]MBV5308538.1 GNAT family N-acetyltransferase/peptidase C39 family protein [Chromatium okenii]